MKSLARFAVTKRWFVIALWLVVAVGINVTAGALGNHYSNSFQLPKTNSTLALELIKSAHSSQVTAGESDQIVFQTTTGTVADQQSTIDPVLAKIRALPGVASVIAPYDPTARGQVSPDGAIAFAVVNFKSAANLIPAASITALIKDATTLRGANLAVSEGGDAIANATQPKGSPGEGIGLLATAIVLIVAFGSLMAMLLPLGVALFAIAIASAATTLLSHVVSIAQFAPILGSLIGLGVGIDYALFIVTRTRQNLQQGMNVEDAIVSSINTSGRAVMFAGATVCVALLGMLALGFDFLSGLGVAASTTVVITMLAAVTLLPALLAFWKTTILSRRERRALAANGPALAEQDGGWQRWAELVAKRPKSFSLAALVAIALFAAPVLSLQLGLSDAGSNPAGSTTRVAYDTLAKGFGAGSNGPLEIVGKVTNASDRTAMATLSANLSTNSNVAFASPPFPLSATVELIKVVPKSAPQAKATDDLITAIRTTYVPAVTAQSHTAIYVGGATAIGMDFASKLDSKIPLFLVIIVVLGSLLLMIAFRSLLIPLTAAFMNLLAVAASFGLVVAVFQWGWGSSLIGSGAGPVEAYLPIIMIAILFGLSMDYQVFLVSRMHEEWSHTKDNELAIVRGQAYTGRIITAAAFIMVCVFFSFAVGGQRIIAEFGIGLGGAVLIDAFVIRTVLVPSLMHYFGKANWWMPAWLDRVIPNVALEAGE
jgi:RND superfamily putative drug exporter